MCNFCTSDFFFNLATDFYCSNMANCHVLSRLTYLANNLYVELYRIYTATRYCNADFLSFIG